jgi:DNA polymerase-3 subunit gamma/tau
MLLYDEINRKGFEGDMALNGFAEFMRNLLVCQNPKAASLLDVIEGVQEKYVEEAKKVSTSYLVSALNILNEAEINYKMARNKRLHAELTLIKLNFLQQAIKLSVEDGGKKKKKRTDAPVAFRTKKIQSLQLPSSLKALPTKPSELYIEKETTAKKTETINEFVTETAATTVKEKVKPSVQTSANPSKQNLLDAIKAKVGKAYEVSEVENPEPLDVEKLSEVWFDFSEKVASEKKYASTNAFKTAHLTVIDDDNFKIEVQSNTQKGLIEQERMILLDSLRQIFKNKRLTFKIEVLETETQHNETPQLNSHQRFEIMTEKNPALQLLKDKLKLNIDY